VLASRNCSKSNANGLTTYAEEQQAEHIAGDMEELRVAEEMRAKREHVLMHRKQESEEAAAAEASTAVVRDMSTLERPQR